MNANVYKSYTGQWLLFYDHTLVKAFSTFDELQIYCDLNNIAFSILNF